MLQMMHLVQGGREDAALTMGAMINMCVQFLNCENLIIIMRNYDGGGDDDDNDDDETVQLIAATPTQQQNTETKRRCVL